MKCRILFSGKSKKNIFSLSSAALAQRVAKVKIIHTMYINDSCNNKNRNFSILRENKLDYFFLTLCFIRIVADDILIFLLFLRENKTTFHLNLLLKNKTWHFCLADASHEVLMLIFFKNNLEIYVCYNFAERQSQLSALCLLVILKVIFANSVDPDQTAP